MAALPPIHTRISAALADASTWPAIGAIVVGAWGLDGVPRYVTIICGIVGVLLKGGQPQGAA